MKHNQYYVAKANPANFERKMVAIIALLCAGVLIYLGLMGPMYKGEIVYRTHPTINNQLIAQDAVNTFLMAPLLIVAAWALLAKKGFARYLLAIAPLFLFYYAISYALGWEWKAADYYGNSENWFFHYIIVLMSALIFLLYSFRLFPTKARYHFKKNQLIIYSVLCSIFLALFAMMWSREVFELWREGTTRGYEFAPTAFWLVRTIDLGICVPLGFVSIYLLWIDPAKSYALQMLFFGFFISMSVVVNAVALVMFLKNDPSYEHGSTIVFIILMLIVFFGYAFVLKGYRAK